MTARDPHPLYGPAAEARAAQRAQWIARLALENAAARALRREGIRVTREKTRLQDVDASPRAA
jgi:hypothetical protein